MTNNKSQIEKATRQISVSEVQALIKEDVYLLDIRSINEFVDGFIPSSVHLSIEKDFLAWAELLITWNQKMLIIGDEKQAKDIIAQMVDKGYENILGYLEGGYEAWHKAGLPADMLIEVSAEELLLDLPFDKKLMVIDVRTPFEFEHGHIKGAQLIPLSEFADILTIAQIDDEKNLYLHCSLGYRSVTACSILKKNGFHNLRNISGGWEELKVIPDMPIVFPANETKD